MKLWRRTRSALLKVPGALLLLTVVVGQSNAQIQLRYYGVQTGVSNSNVCQYGYCLCQTLTEGVCEAAQSPDMMAPSLANSLLEHSDAGDMLLLRLSPTEPIFQLLSSCEPGCGDCLNGTGGRSLTWTATANYCMRSSQDGIFFIINIELLATSSTVETNCVTSLGQVFAVPGIIDSDGDGVLIVIYVVVFVSFIVVCGCSVLYSVLRLRRSGPNVAVPVPGETNTVLADVIGMERIQSSFPETVWQGDPESEETNCVVCMSPVEVGEQCRVLQCSHIFHAACILKWWTHVPRTALQCPVCNRSQVTRETEQGDGTPGGTLNDEAAVSVELEENVPSETL